MITIEADDFEIEQRFAAALANSRGYAKLWNTAGCPQSHHDQVGCALIELWEDGRKAGLEPSVLCDSMSDSCRTEPPDDAGNH